MIRPSELVRATSSPSYAKVALNPQPLPPRWLFPSVHPGAVPSGPAEHGIIIVGGKNPAAAAGLRRGIIIIGG